MIGRLIEMHKEHTMEYQYKRMSRNSCADQPRCFDNAWNASQKLILRNDLERPLAVMAPEASLVVQNAIGSQLIHQVNSLVARLTLGLCYNERHHDPICAPLPSKAPCPAAPIRAARLSHPKSTSICANLRNPSRDFSLSGTPQRQEAQSA